MLRLCVAASVLASSLLSQAQWTPVSSGTPSARAALTQGSDLGGMVIFGGNSVGGVRTNEIWRYDGATRAWTDLSPGGGGAAPIGRHWGGGCVDYVRQRFVVFGGTNDNVNWLGDTWEFDLVNQVWIPMNPPGPTPSPRRWCQLSYDDFHGECILFGGVDQAGNYLNDTWIWNGSTWTEQAPSSVPSPRARHRMIHRFGTTDTLMFGGLDASGVIGETWAWRGSDWLALPTATVPGPTGQGLFAHCLTYDILRDRFVVCGGVETSGTRAETWDFDLVDWAQRADLPANSRSGAAMAYLFLEETTVLYGGFDAIRWDDTWEYRTDTPATFAAGTTGQGCPGSAGTTPLLFLVSPAWAGQTFEVDVAAMDPAASLRAMVFNFGPPIAPIPLAAIGFPSCNFLAGPQLSLPLSGGAMMGEFFSVALPDSRGLYGASWSLQAIGVESEPFWISASDRIDVTIGAL